MTKCILDSRRKNGCGNCTATCPHHIAMHGLNGTGGRVGAAGAGAEYRYTTLANSPVRAHEPRLYAALDKAAETFWRQFPDHEEHGERIKSWYFWSEEPGTGKTTTAVALMHEFIMTNYLGALKRGEQPLQLPALFFDVNSIQRTYNLASQANDEATIREITKRFDKAATVPFLVMDDVGIRKATDAFRGLVHDVVNHRAANGLPTVYTSNVRMTELETLYDKRVYDRIRDMCQDFHINGESKRGKR